jgi:hypothetical protein
MTILDDFKRAISGDKASTSRVMSGIASAVEVYLSEDGRIILQQILAPWSMNIAKNAPLKWLLPASVMPHCAFEIGGTVCNANAIGGCHVCGRPICIDHVFISGDATLVCWECVRVANKHAPKWSSRPEKSGSDSDWAYKLIGVERGATVKEVKKKFKEKISLFHPDKDPNKTGHYDDITKNLNEALKVILAEK